MSLLNESFYFGLQFNFIQDSPFVPKAIEGNAVVPSPGVFLLLDGTNFLLLDGTDFTLL